MTTVKICGIKDAATLALLAELGVDYVGFVFAPSKRQVTATDVGAMLRDVPNAPKSVGVFVNPTLDELDHVMKHAPLDVIQLHGQETPTYSAEVAERYSAKVWKALAVGEQADTLTQVAAYIPHVEAFLFDTHDPKQAGGTGRRFSWAEIPTLREMVKSTHFFVAGGINLENIAELLEQHAPVAIDMSSGVETDGVKDHTKIRAFIGRVREHDQRNK